MDMKLDFALELVDKALKVNPEESNSLSTKAWVLFKLGRSSEANELIDKYISLQNQESIDNSIECLYEISKIKKSVNDTVKARECLTKILKFNELNASEKKFVEDIKKDYKIL
jgi:tetratricopeptide (TPR) repeat protein